MGDRLRTLLLAGLVPLAACSETSILSPAGPIAAGNRAILLNSLVIMLAIAIPTMFAILGFAWWFRAGNKRAVHRPNFVFSGKLELLVWSVPLLVILFLGSLIWIGSHRLDPKVPLKAGSEASLEVQVVALEWKWLFIYPDEGIASVNRLVIPVGRPVSFTITSASVMNNFFVPRLGSQIYAMNGMATKLHLQADQAGRYFGTAAHFSGDGFADMTFAVDAVAPEQFGGWTARTRASAPPLDVDGYRVLQRQGSPVRPLVYGTIQPGLFDAIVTRRIPPSPGPQTGAR